MAVKGCIEGPFSHTTTTGLAHVLIGEDPFRTEYLWHKMYRANIYGGRRGIAIHAMSGIDLALWDIKGKALGLPVWKLLGGGFTESLRPYASSLFGATPAETGERARRFADQGFTAVKFGWDPMGKDAKTDVALVREARAGLGPDLDLMIDAGLVYDAKTAIQRARAFEQYDPFWFEEPLLPDDYEGYAKLSAATSLRIAAGEEESERKSFLQLMDVGKIDVVQVDLTRCGGFTEAMKIAALAADRGLPVVNHGFTTYLNVAAALHLPGQHPQHARPARVRRRGRDHAAALDQRADPRGRRPGRRPRRARPGARAERGGDRAVPGLVSRSTERGVSEQEHRRTMPTAEQIIAALRLKPHPIEGGYFRETYRVVGDASRHVGLPGRLSGPRARDRWGRRSTTC